MEDINKLKMNMLLIQPVLPTKILQPYSNYSQPTPKIKLLPPVFNFKIKKLFLTIGGIMN